jgi:hypothetical protein
MHSKVLQLFTSLQYYCHAVFISGLEWSVVNIRFCFFFCFPTSSVYIFHWSGKLPICWKENEGKKLNIKEKEWTTVQSSATHTHCKEFRIVDLMWLHVNRESFMKKKKLWDECIKLSTSFSSFSPSIIFSGKKKKKLFKKIVWRHEHCSFSPVAIEVKCMEWRFQSNSKK